MVLEKPRGCVDALGPVGRRGKCERCPFGDRPKVASRSDSTVTYIEPERMTEPCHPFGSLSALRKVKLLERADSFSVLAVPFAGIAQILPISADSYRGLFFTSSCPDLRPRKGGVLKSSASNDSRRCCSMQPDAFNAVNVASGRLFTICNASSDS